MTGHQRGDARKRDAMRQMQADVDAMWERVQQRIDAGDWSWSDGVDEPLTDNEPCDPTTELNRADKEAHQ